MGSAGQRIRGWGWDGKGVGGQPTRQAGVLIKRGAQVPDVECGVGGAADRQGRQTSAGFAKKQAGVRKAGGWMLTRAAHTTHRAVAQHGQLAEEAVVVRGLKARRGDMAVA